jgi:hypothetical protein
VERKLQRVREDEEDDIEEEKGEKKISTINFWFEVLTMGNMKVF